MSNVIPMFNDPEDYEVWEQQRASQAERNRDFWRGYAERNRRNPDIADAAHKKAREFERQMPGGSR